MNPSFSEMTRRLGELSGAQPREIPPLKTIDVPLAQLDLRNMHAEELKWVGLSGRKNPHD